MKPSVPTHYRAASLIFGVVSVLGLARVGRPPSIPPPAPVVRHDAGVTKIDPNTATARELEALPGIGPSLARRVLDAREKGVRFRAPRDLSRVRGIGPRTVERLAPYLLFDANDGVRDPVATRDPP
jgi:competence protein ComEA